MGHVNKVQNKIELIFTKKNFGKTKYSKTRRKNFRKVSSEFVFCHLPT